MSRRGARRRGSVKRPSNAVAAWVSPGSNNTGNTTDYNPTVNLGADAADRAFVIVVTQRGNATVDPDAVTLTGGDSVPHALERVGSLGGNNINFSVWWLPGGVFPTGASATVLVDNNNTGTGARTMCNVQPFRVTGQSDSAPSWVSFIMNAGAGTLLDLSPPATQTDGATIVVSAAPGSNATYTWAGATEAYDAATESSDCRVSGGVAVGLPAALTATMSASVTNLMGAAIHIR